MQMRILHRYLGFFLSGIMLVYALSGIVLIFRDSDTFKVEKQMTKSVEPNMGEDELGKALRIRNLKFTKQEGDLAYFDAGVYNKQTGEANYVTKQLPYLLDKLTHLHKARSQDPLFFLNIFFGLGLLFFVVSSFWMFMPGSSVFKKGMIYTAAGVVLTLVLLFV